MEICGKSVRSTFISYSVKEIVLEVRRPHGGGESRDAQLLPPQYYRLLAGSAKGPGGNAEHARRTAQLGSCQPCQPPEVTRPGTVKPLKPLLLQRGCQPLAKARVCRPAWPTTQLIYIHR